MGNVSDWEVNGDGFATGPVIEVENGDNPVTVSAVWTDEDGVCVSVDTGDEPLKARVAYRVCAAIMELAAVSAPELSSS
ncbi:hypothetical protein PBI_LUNAR_50 [Arthrobacter phage Lunar]|uniref:Uncharacterized protein n=3 Tax=Coralvirus coral TaxID=2734227 RepID=A0A3G2KHJ8_9CAUD|nr:hypothetical protein PBI_COTE_51 [Arthrobacter phage Cote]AYN58455.1 hypothetical protein PBI_LUNAR_50 [Arthrobacter phage Lunar]AYN58597.1 hypothetical protein PBI_MELONS_50 [Arthrobacter phage Melons]